MRQEHQTSLEQLEHDRALLAEAWDRVEQERIKCAQAPRKVVVNPFAPQVPVSSVTPSSEDPVIQAVLSQFQTLRRDVRKASRVD
jgi:hypothetical protein